MMQQRLIRTIFVGTLASSTLLASCEADEVEPEQPPSVTPRTEEVAEEPERFLNRRVTLVGEVDDLQGPRAFKLEGNQELFGEELLVLTRSPVSFGRTPLEEGDDVTVSGTVRNFVVGEVEQELDWDLTAELEAEWRDKTALIADSVTKIDEYARWSDKAAEGTRVGLLSIYMAPDPHTLDGDRISLEGVRVQSVKGNGIWIGENHFSQMLVASAEGTSMPQLQPGDWVDVEGTLKAMPPVDEALKQFGFSTADASDHLREQLQEEILFIDAQSVQKNEEAKQKAESRKGAKVDFERIGETPATHIGKTVEGEAEVTDVISNQAFWLKNGASDQKVLGVMLNDAERESLTNLSVGQRVKFSALAMAPKDVDTTSLKLAPNSRRTLQAQPVVLAMQPNDVEVVDKNPRGASTATGSGKEETGTMKEESETSPRSPQPGANPGPERENSLPGGRPTTTAPQPPDGQPMPMPPERENTRPGPGQGMNPPSPDVH